MGQGESNGLSFLYLNARSIVNKFDEFMVVVTERSPDVIGVTESWAKDDVLSSELNIEGYVMFRVDRKKCDATRGGGVLLYVRENLSPVEFIPQTEYPEHVWCRLRDAGGGDLLVGVCYRTTSEGIFECDENVQIRRLLEELKNRCTLLMGDFNYGGIDWKGRDSTKASVEGGKFQECVEENFYVQYVEEATRETMYST